MDVNHMLRLVSLAPLIFCLSGCNSESVETRAVKLSTGPPPPKTEIAITSFCSACHPMPNPTSFARERWHHEVKQGIDLYRKSQRTDLVIPDFDATLDWFEEFADERLTFESLDAAETEHPFEREELTWGEPGLFAASHFVIPDAESPNDVVIADMGSGDIWQAALDDNGLRGDSIAKLGNPAHVEATDLDGDGERDYLVADLGGFFPQRHKRGTIWWLRPVADGKWERIAIKMGMMRVCDVRAVDYDGDKDLDLVVAEFGWHFQGGIHLLTNTGQIDGVPQFESQSLDDRPGAIHVPIADLNGDDRPDFIALISQHHETVVAFLNQGDGTFRTETIYEAGDPAYGSSGIEMVDFDGDGDLDVLMSNGDTFDDEIPKPIHSIQWLENEGSFPFTHRPIGQMPGAYRAVAGDVDLDGDMDVAAVALLGEKSVAKEPPGTFDGVAYFEQTDDGSFIRHRLQVDRCDSATCRLADMDGDGDLDLITVPYSTVLSPSSTITLFRNKTR